MVDRWPLTGRDEELRIVTESLTDSEHRGIVIAGPAGVGKTRLARAAADTASGSGWSVRRVAGTATGRPVTLGAFARWADDTDPTPSALARKVFAALTAGTDGAPLLVFVDDAHLLDDMSAFLVHQLVLQDVASVIATIRTGEPPPDAVTALWKDGLLRRLELQPLSHSESDALLQTVLDGLPSTEAADRMWELSRGNVLFLHHLVEHERNSGRLSRIDGEWRWAGAPSASPVLVELVEQQIGAVPDEVREVVDLVAIAEPIDQQLLTALIDREWVEAAEQRGLITAASADAVCVGHPLYGEIRRGQCGPLRLRRLRGRVATAMAEAETYDPLRLGLLWLESDLPPDAGIFSRAANVAGKRLDLGLAERLARAAVDAQPSSSTKLALAYFLVLLAKGEEAEEILDSLSPQDLAAPRFVDGVILRASNLLWPLRNPEEARRVIDDSIALSDEERNHASRAFRAVTQVLAAEPAETLETMAAVNYDRLDNYGRILGYATETLALGELGRAKEAGDKALAGYRVLAESPLDAFHATGMAEFHAYALLAAGYVDDAVAAAEEGHRHYKDLSGMTRSMAIATLGMTTIGKGDLASALRYLQTARESFGDSNDIGLFFRFGILQAEALARSGDVDAAVAALEETRRTRHPAYLYVEPAYLIAAGWVGAARGRISDAREIVDRAIEFARTHGQPAREVLALQTLVQLGDASRADRLTELANRVEGPRAPLAARYARSLSQDDGAELDAVSRDFEAMGDVLAAADSAAQAATSHRLAGRRGSALSSSARAQALAKRCGGAVSPALAASKVSVPFTRREHEIVNLVSRGLSNKAIAEATSLSVRTVEAHIYKASSKAGVSSRTELSALVRQFNELEPSPST